MIQWGTMTIHERMALRTDKKQPHECWLWNGPLQNDGYAHIKFSGITMKAHRVAWLLANGEIIDGRFVCHHAAALNDLRKKLGDFAAACERGGKT